MTAVICFSLLCVCVCMCVCVCVRALCLFVLIFYMQIGVCHDAATIGGRGSCPGLWLDAAGRPPDIKGANFICYFGFSPPWRLILFSIDYII